ncbi:hypothetical protein GCM10023220_23310 [Streptomyces ziwulingensis]|uniref:Uncharacterized protein n=1 Tax=Streptomyces ziwulingensis TaxID=1045501 RepID=A0ABP9BII9_9ACTN
MLTGSGHNGVDRLAGDLVHEVDANGAGSEPCTDVFLRWGDESGPQWLEDVEVCLKVENPMASGCTILRGHPGRCDWEYIDPSGLWAGPRP